jgi:hypothetical protein
MRVAEHESGLHGADHVDQAELGIPIHHQRIIAEIEELYIVDVERLRGGFGLLAPRRLHLFQRHALFLPELGAFAALAEGQADHRDLVAPLLVQRDGAAAAPDEIGGMRADDKSRPGHDSSYFLTGGVPCV